jgi:hypothetical protein
VPLLVSFQSCGRHDYEHSFSPEHCSMLHVAPTEDSSCLPLLPCMNMLPNKLRLHLISNVVQIDPLLARSNIPYPLSYMHIKISDVGCRHADLSHSRRCDRRHAMRRHARARGQEQVGRQAGRQAGRPPTTHFGERGDDYCMIRRD